MKKIIIGVMGPGKGATKKDMDNAYELGSEIAKNDWLLLSGGRNQGVMDAVSKGAHDSGGLVIGILPSKDGSDASEAVDIRIITGFGGGRNVINVLSSDVVIACGMGAGTSSEIGHAVKIGKPIILLETGRKAEEFFKELAPESVHITKNVNGTIQLIKKLLK